jgi:hypothetical protein
MVTFSTRVLVLAGMIALPVCALIACTAGDEIAYQSSALTGDSGIIPDEAGRLVAESGIEVRPPANDGGTLPPTGPVQGCPIIDPDGGCDTSAGKGCCLPNTGVSSASNTCVDQVDYFSGLGKTCSQDRDVFLSCIGTDGDNTCCWEPGENGTFNTRFRAFCDGGIEACNPNGPDGGPGICLNGQTCMKKTCKGIDTGGCGADPPCQE